MPKFRFAHNLTRLWPIAAILAVIFAFYLPVLGGKLPIPADAVSRMFYPLNAANLANYQAPQNELLTDVIRQLYPWRQFAVSELKSGRMPWWNPYNFSGTPHLANFQSAVFYPLNLVFWLVDFPTGWTILVISQQVLGALFLYLYLKSRSLKPIACVFGALTWIFSGFFVAWLEWNTLVHTALWAPLILLAMDKLTLSSSGRRWHLVLTFSLICQFLAGSPAIWLYLSLLQLSYLMLVCRPSFREAKGLILDYLTFLMIISVQLIPTLDFIALSNRSIDVGTPLTDPTWFLPLPNLIQLLIPDFFGNPAAHNYWGIFNYVEFVSFIGSIPLFFALFNLSFKNQTDRLVKFLLVWTLVSFLLAAKNPLSILQVTLKLPLLSVSNASRWLVIAELTLSILAAFGTHRFLTTKPKPTSLWPILVCHFIFIISWIFTLVPKLRPANFPDQSLAATQQGLIIPTVVLLIQTIALGLIVFTPAQKVISIPKTIISRRLITSLLVAISAIIGLSFAHNFTVFSSPTDLYPANSQIITYLQTHAGFYRYLTLDRNIMTPNINLPYGLYTIEGYDSLYLNDYGRLITATQTNYLPPVSGSFKRLITTNAYQSPLVDLLGVKYILSFDSLSDKHLKFIMEEGLTKLYENLEVFPRAFVTGSTDIFSPDSIEEAHIISYRPNQVIIKVDSATGGFLVLTDTWHPDWTATLDGLPAKVINWAGLRATIIPGGVHEVRYVYHQYSHPQF